MSELVERVKIALREVPDINGVTDAEGEARAAIAAVVRALRDETEMRSCACRFWLDEILGDAGEKVGTHGCPELDADARKLAALGQDPGATFVTDPAPVCECKPIETAPKDGTEFIVFRDDAGVFTARYVASNDDGEMFLASMYGEDLTGDMMPTHWMPLPPPPEAKE